MPSQFNRPANKQNPVATFITPGRRALGEAWRKVTIYPDPDTGKYIIDNEATEAPADNKAIIIPGMGNISIEMADYFLEWQRDKAKERAKRLPTETDMRDTAQELNEAWHDYIEQKLRTFQGKTTIGSKLYQRESHHGN